MTDAKQHAAEFLREKNMWYGDIDMGQYCDVFLGEMDKGLAGKDSSLKMIPTYIETGKDIGKNKTVIVMDAGGTNFRAATVYFDKHGEPVIKDAIKKTMPGVKEPVSNENFFDIMAGFINDIAEKSDVIGFCFSYPCDMQPNKDGRLIHFSKEIKADGVIGQMIGANLIAAIERCHEARSKRVVILNDTAAALLAGHIACVGKTFDSYIGFILGTGTNTCYIESNRSIPKLTDSDLAGSQIINVESGAFTKAPQGEIDRQFDALTDNPGVHTFEKMIAGGYLGPLCLEVIRAAASENLFSSPAAEAISFIGALETKDLSEFLTSALAFARKRGGVGVLAEAVARGDSADGDLLKSLIEMIIQRAAKLTAINLSAVVLKSGKGRSPEKPVCIVVEGTTFYSLIGMKEMVEKYLMDFLVGAKQRHYEIVNIKNATLIGAAIAALTN